MSVLITGISGFVGKKLLSLIKDQKQTTYYLLLRGKTFLKYKKELKRYSHLRPVKGHLLHPNLFAECEDYDECREKVDTIIHLAGIYDLSAKKKDLYMGNVLGTQNVVFFASQVNNLKKFIHASSIAIAGDHEGEFKETDYDLGQSFSNAYAETKFEAEGVVRNFSHSNKSVQTDILRFGIIIGDSNTGEYEKIDGPYIFLHKLNLPLEGIKKMINLLRYPLPTFFLLPYNQHSQLAVVPVDFIASSLLKIMSSRGRGKRTFHLISKNTPTLKTFLEDYLSTIELKGTIKEIPESNIFKSSLRKVAPYLKIPRSYIDYMYSKTLITAGNYPKVIGAELPDYNDYKKVFLKMAYVTIKSGKIKK